MTLSVDLDGRADNHASVARQRRHPRRNAGVVTDLLPEELENELGEAIRDGARLSESWDRR